MRTQARLPESIRTAGQSRPFIRSSGLFIILLASPARLAARASLQLCGEVLIPSLFPFFVPVSYTHLDVYKRQHLALHLCLVHVVVAQQMQRAVDGEVHELSLEAVTVLQALRLSLIHI